MHYAIKWIEQQFSWSQLTSNCRTEEWNVSFERTVVLFLGTNHSFSWAITRRWCCIPLHRLFTKSFNNQEDWFSNDFVFVHSSEGLQKSAIYSIKCPFFSDLFYETNVFLFTVPYAVPAVQNKLQRGNNIADNFRIKCKNSTDMTILEGKKFKHFKYFNNP